MGNNYDPFNAELSDKKRRKLEKQKVRENEQLLKTALDDEKFDYNSQDKYARTNDFDQTNNYDQTNSNNQTNSFEQVSSNNQASSNSQASNTFNNNSNAENKKCAREERKAKVRAEMQVRKNERTLEKKEKRLLRKLKVWVIIILLALIYVVGEGFVDSLNGSGTSMFDTTDADSYYEDQESEEQRQEDGANDRIEADSSILESTGTESYTFTKEDFELNEEGEYEFDCDDLVSEGVYQVVYSSPDANDTLNYYGEYNIDYDVDDSGKTVLNNMNINYYTRFTVGSETDFTLEFIPQDSYVNFDPADPKLGMYMSGSTIDSGTYMIDTTNAEASEGVFVGEVLAIFKTEYYPLDKMTLNKGDILYYTNPNFKVENVE